jgi:hypothetical protein
MAWIARTSGLCPRTRGSRIRQKRRGHVRICTARRARSGTSEIVSRPVRRSFDAQRRMKSESEWVTDGFEQPSRGLSEDIERSGGGTAIVTVEGRRVLRVYAAGRW